MKRVSSVSGWSQGPRARFAGGAAGIFVSVLAFGQVPAPDFVIDFPIVAPTTFEYRFQGPPGSPYTISMWEIEAQVSPPVEIIRNPPIWQPTGVQPFSSQGEILLAPGNPWGGAPLRNAMVNGAYSGNCTFWDPTPERATFSVELLSLDISGGTLPPGFMIRESPTRASLGETHVRSLGGGQWRVDSFFDVFTELSIDGGQTWTPSNTPARFELIPTPGSGALLACAMGWAMRRRREVL